MVLRSKKMNKKGSLLDLVVIAVFVFAFALSSLVGWVILEKFNEQTAGEGTLSERGTNITNDLQDSYSFTFDGLIVFVLAGLIVALIVSVMLIRTHPGFLWVSLFLLVIFGVVFFVLQETWSEVTDETLFSTETNATAQFPITDYAMTNLLTILLIAGLVAVIVMYAKFGSGWS